MNFHIIATLWGYFIRDYLVESPDRFVILRERDWKEMAGSLQNEIYSRCSAPYFFEG